MSVFVERPEDRLRREEPAVPVLPGEEDVLMGAGRALRAR
jgi:hypothetical protein